MGTEVMSVSQGKKRKLDDDTYTLTVSGIHAFIKDTSPLSCTVSVNNAVGNSFSLFLGLVVQN